jgi:dTDP-L-rhamnose 4-epimerase
VDVGSGVPTTIHELAQTIAAICDAPEPVVVAKFRDGDVRAAQCDINSATKELGWRPKWSIEDGLRDLLQWIGDGCEHASTSTEQVQLAVKA